MTKAFASFALRFLARLALALWFGGFTFYAAVVVPDLHDHLGGMETGEISRRVVITLYGIGASSLILGWLVAITDRHCRIGWPGKARLGLLAINTALLLTLVSMHRSLGIRLDSGEDLAGFRSFHEVYLTVWTGQWLAIVGLIGLDWAKVPPEEAETHLAASSEL